jgi:L-seryl-tRNA(Ser) seleniumtransferase
VARLKKHALARAIRADKLCLAALSATLLHYLKNEAEREIPIWRMISASLDQLEGRARSWAAYLTSCGLAADVVYGESTIGGGSLPGETLPAWLLTLTGSSPRRFTDRLRRASLPVIARIQDDLVVMDPRTVLPEQDETLLNTILAISR